MKNPAIHIRYATVSDAALLAELGAKTFQDTFAADNTPENMVAYIETAFGPAVQAAELNRETSLFLIAESDDEAIGYARLRWKDTHTVELQRIYVLNVWMGHGVGGALMEACLQEAETRGFATIWLGVWEHNPRAVAFYKKWGFEQVGTHVFHLGDDPQTDLIMQRKIRG